MNRNDLIRLNWILSSQLGIDIPHFAYSIRRINQYLRDWKMFRKNYKGNMIIKPCLHDRYEEGGMIRSEYFWQDLFVAQQIYKSKPKRHVDIGSRIDGFAAHIASFMEIEIFDIRPINANIPGMIFREFDVMSKNGMPDEYRATYYDSITCLHAIEHFGLGRYDDPINPTGYIQGISNMAEMLRKGGTLYLSTPIGRERVEFNANRIFDPRTIISIAKESDLKVKQLFLISHNGIEKQNRITDSLLEELAKKSYNLGLFVFQK